jgi:hypothetical protein
MIIYHARQTSFTEAETKTYGILTSHPYVVNILRTFGGGTPPFIPQYHRIPKIQTPREFRSGRRISKNAKTEEQ